MNPIMERIRNEKAEEAKKIKELMEVDQFKKLYYLFYSVEFGHVDGSEWQLDNSSLLLLWNFFLTTALQE